MLCSAFVAQPEQGVQICSRADGSRSVVGPGDPDLPAGHGISMHCQSRGSRSVGIPKNSDLLPDQRSRACCQTTDPRSACYQTREPRLARESRAAIRPENRNLSAEQRILTPWRSKDSRSHSLGIPTGSRTLVPGFHCFNHFQKLVN